MKKILGFYAFWTVMMLFVPFLVVRGWVGNNTRVQSVTEEGEAQSFVVKVLISENQVAEMPLKEYLCGVVAGEMPPTYHKEALKAQAVASNTYMLYRMEAMTENPELYPGHNGAYVCTDYRHCKAFLSKEQAKQKWGENWFNTHYYLIENAVDEVLGKAIFYNETPINAVFHSMSAGTTANAREVWGSDIPYLVNVDSSFDAQEKDYISTLDCDKQSFIEKLSGYDDEIEFSSDIKEWVKETVNTPSGYVENITICNKTYKGTQIREIFGLRSASFTLSEEDGGFSFTVKGYGHGVGMSQTGANYLAGEGKNYTEILQYYYKDTTIRDHPGE